MSQWASLVVKLGTLLFAVELPHTFSINLQLLGGVWILQLAPMLIGGLFTRWFHRWALLAGWLAGMVFGTLAAYNVSNATTSHWAASSDIEFGHTVYIGLSAAVLNLVIAVALTLLLRAARVPEGTDETLPGQYTADPEQAPARAPAGVGALLSRSPPGARNPCLLPRRPAKTAGLLSPRQGRALWLAGLKISHPERSAASNGSFRSCFTQR